MYEKTRQVAKFSRLVLKQKNKGEAHRYGAPSRAAGEK